VSVLRAAARASTTATPETVYRLLSQGSTWPTWIDVDSMAMESEGAHGGESVGAIRVFRFRRFGLPLKTRERIVELVPNRRFSYELVSGLPLEGYRADVDLSPGPGGGTVITWSGTWRTGVPGTGIVTKAMFARLYRQFATGLARKADSM
jgi:Polyketide cyclase / dehydrase and lipid transport